VKLWFVFTYYLLATSCGFIWCN